MKAEKYMVLAAVAFVFFACPLKGAALSVRESLAMIETGATSMARGKWDHTRGSSGEVSRFQIMPDVWRRYTRSRSWTNPEVAWSVAQKIIEDRIDEFQEKVGREPEPVELYLLWNKPGHFAANGYKFYLVNRSYLLRARRFANLVLQGR